jgi:ABC-type uncharacterized transport system ATPase subunit
MTATNDQILAAINAMNSRVQQGLLALQSQLGFDMSEMQSNIDAAVTTISGFFDDVNAKTADILTDVDSLKTLIAAGQTPDLSALDALAGKVTSLQSGLDSAAGSLDQLSASPAPAPSPAPDQPPASA